MKRSNLLATVAIGGLGVVLAAFIVRAPQSDHHDEHGHDEHADHDDETRGPHGGRLLGDDGFAVEVTIYERGVPPEFRVYAYAGHRRVDPQELSLVLELTRLGGETNVFTFVPMGEYLRSREVVEEPHSFDVVVAVTHDGEQRRFEYASYEGRVELSADAVRAASIEIAVAGPATVRSTLDLSGRVAPNEDRLAHVIPRFPGVVKEVRKRLGDAVARGETLAVIQSNESLELYELQSEIAGTVIAKHATPGEFVAESDAVYVVADLTSVWVDLNVYRQDFPRLEVGQRVLLDAGEGIAKAEGRIDYISPFGAPSTQTMLARVDLPNPDGAWRPGLFVTAEVVVEEASVPVAVDEAALQTFRDWDVVFVQERDFFEARPVELGGRDGERVEIIAGLAAGQRYATKNSFILKAELGKAGISHDH